MKTWQGTLSGTLGIVAVVVVGIWHANGPDIERWDLSTITSGGATPKAAPEFSVSRVQWSADGRVLLSLSRGGRDAEGRLALHDMKQNTFWIPFDAMGYSVTSAALAPDGRHVLVGSSQGCLQWTTLESSDVPTMLVKLPRLEQFSAVAISNDGHHVAGATNLGSIYVCDLPSRTSITLTASQIGSIADLRFSKDDLWLVSAQNNGRISLWEHSNGELSQEFVGCAGSCQAAEFLPDGKRIVSAGLDDTVRIWDIASGRETWRGEFGLLGVTTLAVSADGMTAAWGGHNRKIVVWDLQRGQKRFDIATSASAVFHLKFSPDGSLLAAAGSEGMIRLYNVKTGTEQDGIEIDDIVTQFRR